MSIVNHGKICYLEIPAVDVDVSSRFYADVFGWGLRNHGDGSVAFDDSNGYVSGMWVLDRPPMTEAGIIISVMVDSVAEVSDRVLQFGGAIVRPLDPEGPEKIAWFGDPAGNLMGLYEEPGD
jgi:predicted enzyme related to lactoylglutathione lyase